MKTQARLPATILRLPTWLGDFVMAEPVVRAAYEHYRRAGQEERLSLLAPLAFLALLEGRFPGARRIPCTRTETKVAYRGHERALFFNGSLASVIAALAAGVSERIGWAGNARSPFLTYALQRAKECGRRPIGWGREPARKRILPRPFAADCAELALQAGIVVEHVIPKLEVSAQAQRLAQRRLARAPIADSPGPLIALNVGHRPGSAKGVGADLWARLLEELAQRRSYRFVLLAGPGEEGTVQAVQKLLRLARPLPVDDPCAELPELAAFAAEADLFVTADGGARHVAKAVGACTVAIFGPTDPRHTAHALEREELLTTSVSCAPCHRELCPLSGRDENRCMRGHDPVLLADLVERSLLRSRSRELLPAAFSLDLS